MNKAAPKIRFRIALAGLLAVAALSCPPAQATIDATYTGHDFVSVTSTVNVSEIYPVRFGNFAVGSPGGNGASITLTYNGTRTRVNGTTTTITLLNGGYAGMGTEGAGEYQVSGAAVNTNLYVSFTDSSGVAISSTNPVVLTGPVGSGTFNVDSMNFNATGTDTTGPYIVSDSSGNATIFVGATLHTVSGVTTYAPGTYRGTFNLIVNY